MTKILLKNSLKILPKDPRDYNLGAVFPQIDVKKIPQDFIVSEPLIIKDQGETDYCSAYALTSVSEDQEGEILYPEYQFFKTKKISGNFDEWGADLRDACKSATEFGSLPVRYKTNQGLDRNKLLQEEQWSPNLDNIASLFKKTHYFSVKGKYDVFDNIRTALYQHRKDKCTILTGALWRQSWLDSQNGILPPIYEDGGFGHAFKIFGWKTIKEQLYLVAQLSQGTEVGDNGLFYISREITNNEIGPYGLFMFKDLPKEGVASVVEEKESIKKKKGFFSWIINLFY